MLELSALASAFTTLFVIVDPIGLTPVFVALTRGMSDYQRRVLAVRTCVISVGILMVFTIFGEKLLDFVGITMPAFRIAGGLLLFLTALDMLFERRQARREDRAEEEDAMPDPSVFPLAIPLIAGPGAIATMILLTGRAEGAVAFGGVVVAMMAVICIVFALLMIAGPIERALGKTGINVVTRLLGMLLAALSVQFILDGLRSFGLGS